MKYVGILGASVSEKLERIPRLVASFFSVGLAIRKFTILFLGLHIKKKLHLNNIFLKLFLNLFYALMPNIGHYFLSRLVRNFEVK